MVFELIISLFIVFFLPRDQLEILTMNTSIIQLYLRRKQDEVADWDWILGPIIVVQLSMPKSNILLMGKRSLAIGFQ